MDLRVLRLQESDWNCLSTEWKVHSRLSRSPTCSFYMCSVFLPALEVCKDDAEALMACFLDHVCHLYQ